MCNLSFYLPYNIIETKQFKIMKKLLFLIIVIGVAVLSSCESRSARVARYNKSKSTVEAKHESTDNKLRIERIDGHDYVIYDNGQFGNSMVHHAGCKTDNRGHSL